MTSRCSSKLRVAIVLAAPETVGGGYSQSITIARMFSATTNAPYSVECVAIESANVNTLKGAGIEVRTGVDSVAGPIERLVSGNTLFRSLLYPMLRTIMRWGGYKLAGQTNLDALAKKHGYDLLIFTSPCRSVLTVRRTPFVYTIFDVCHRDHPEFPECRDDGTFEWRERLFRYALPRASAIIVDTQNLASRIAQLYGIDEARTIVVPYQASIELLDSPHLSQTESERKIAHYGLNRPFLFYPAQFWAHKNHQYIIRALKILKDEHGIMLDLVLTGTNRGYLGEVLSLSQVLGVREQIKYLGFVPIADVAFFYRQSVALVMPTYFGPTNIPPIEAKAMGCQVIYSDEPGFREFCGPGALYCDLSSPDSLVRCIQVAMTRPRPCPEAPSPQDATFEAIQRFMRVMAAKLRAAEAS